MEKRITIQGRLKGTQFWMTIQKGLTAEEATDALAENMKDDAKWDEKWEYQFITE